MAFPLAGGFSPTISSRKECAWALLGMPKPLGLGPTECISPVRRLGFMKLTSKQGRHRSYVANAAPQPVGGSNHGLEVLHLVWKLLLQRFPYDIVFLEKDDELLWKGVYNTLDLIVNVPPELQSPSKIPLHLGRVKSLKDPNALGNSQCIIITDSIQNLPGWVYPELPSYAENKVIIVYDPAESDLKKMVLTTDTEYTSFYHEGDLELILKLFQQNVDYAECQSRTILFGVDGNLRWLVHLWLCNEYYN